MSVRIDTREEVPGLGVSIDDIRSLAGEALSVLGVNLRGGAPTVETIYSHALTELSVDMGDLLDHLEKANDPVATAVRRFRDRISLLNECAATLAKLYASSRDREAGE